jgi:tetratricopeptide (TPR) repeat protein
MATKTIEELKKELHGATQNRKKVRILVELSDRFYLSDSIVALHYAKEAVKYSKALADDIDKGIALSKYGRCLNKTSDHVKAREILQEALRIFREVGAASEIPRTMNLLANSYLPTAEYAKALTIYTEALELATKLNDDLTRELLLGNIGLSYRNIGDYYRSFKYQSESFELAQKLGTVDLAPGYLNLGIVYWELNEHEKAREYLEKALELATASNDMIGVQKSLLNLSELDETDGKLDEALDKCEKALVIAKDYDFRNEEAKILQRFATLYGLKEDYKSALRYFDKALELSVNYDLNTNIPSIFQLKGQILVLQKQYEEAEPMLKEGVAIAKHQGEKQTEAELHQLLSQCLTARGDFQGALEHYQRYSELRNELFVEDQRQAMVQAHIRLEVESSLREAEEHRRERERLEHELAVKQQELTAVALQIAKQNETLGKLTEQLRVLPADGKDGKKKTTSILHEIDRLRNNTNDWKMFESQFDSIHAGFNAKLLENYPLLTPKEVRVCALMKLNLSSKDIANTLAISQRTVEVHRLQIRKKMKLKQTDNLATKLVAI